MPNGLDNGRRDGRHGSNDDRALLALVLARRGQPTEAAQLGDLAFDASWRLCRTDLFLASDLDRLLP